MSAGDSVSPLSLPPAYVARAVRVEMPRFTLALHEPNGEGTIIPC